MPCASPKQAVVQVSGDAIRNMIIGEHHTFINGMTSRGVTSSILTLSTLAWKRDLAMKIKDIPVAPETTSLDGCNGNQLALARIRKCNRQQDG